MSNGAVEDGVNVRPVTHKPGPLHDKLGDAASVFRRPFIGQGRATTWREDPRAIRPPDHLIDGLDLQGCLRIFEGNDLPIRKFPQKPSIR